MTLLSLVFFSSEYASINIYPPTYLPLSSLGTFNEMLYQENELGLQFLCLMTDLLSVWDLSLQCTVSL